MFNMYSSDITKYFVIMNSQVDKLHLYLSVATLTSLYLSYFLNLVSLSIKNNEKREANFVKTPFRVVQY